MQNHNFYSQLVLDKITIAGILILHKVACLIQEQLQIILAQIIKKNVIYFTKSKSF